jgi:predicted permease
MQFFEIFKTTFSLFLLITVGYISRKKKIINDQATIDFSRFLLKILFPIYLFQAASSYMTRAYVFSAPIYFLVNFILLIILYFLSKPLARFFHISPERESTFRLCSIMGNTGFFGMIFAASFYGPQGIVAATLYDFGGSIPFFLILLPSLFQRDHKGNIFAIFKEPNIIAVIFGMIIGILGLKIPDFFSPAFQMVSRITLPLALIMCGSQLAGIQTFAGHKYSQIWYLILIKMVLSPLISLGIVWFLPLEPLMKQFVILDAAMPTGISMVNFTKAFDKDTDFAAISIFSTTTVALLWLPVLMIGLSSLFS